MNTQRQAAGAVKAGDKIGGQWASLERAAATGPAVKRYEVIDGVVLHQEIADLRAEQAQLDVIIASAKSRQTELGERVAARLALAEFPDAVRLSLKGNENWDLRIDEMELADGTVLEPCDRGCPELDDMVIEKDSQSPDRDIDIRAAVSERIYNKGMLTRFVDLENMGPRKYLAVLNSAAQTQGEVGRSRTRSDFEQELTAAVNGRGSDYISVPDGTTPEQREWIVTEALTNHRNDETLDDYESGRFQTNLQDAIDHVIASTQ